MGKTSGDPREVANRGLEDEVRRQLRIIQAIGNSSPDFTYLFDRDHRFVYVSPPLLALWGKTLEEAVGKNFAELGYPPELVRLHTRQLDEALAGHTVSGANAFVGKDGAEGHYEYTFVPVLGDDGRVETIVGTTRDVTARVRAEKGKAEAFERLRESEERFRSFADAMPQLAWMAQADGTVDWYNRRWYQYTGTTPARMAADGWKSVHDPRELPGILQRWEASLRTGEPFEMELPLRAGDGSFRWFLTLISPLKSAEGRVQRWFGTHTDVHDARVAASNWQTLNQVGKMISAELDLQKLVQFVTDAATRMTGAQFGAFFYNVKEESGEAYTLYTISGVPREAFARFPMPRATPVFRPTFEGSQVVRSADITKDPRYGKTAPHFGMPAGHPPVASYLAVPVVSRSGEVMGGLFFGHAAPGVFTEREEELVKALASQAAVAIDNARLFEHARAAIHLRDEFLSIASHELKTPLTPLRMQLQMLSRHVEQGTLGELSPERIGKLAQTCDRQILRLTSLVEDLLDVARINAGRLRLDLQATDLVAIVKGALERHAAQMIAAHCPARVSAPAQLVGRWDPLRLEQVFVNLLSNAIKYAPGAPIEIVVAQEGDEALLSVRDGGQGIAEQDRERVFRRYERVARTDSVGGLGLGLFITHQIVEAHQGSVRVESLPGHGATFIVRLPLRPAE